MFAWSFLVRVVIPAFIPVLVLIYYIIKLDRVEKEPLQKLVKVFLYGMGSTVIAIILETIMEKVIGIYFNQSILIYNLAENFLGIALIEELCKFFIIYILVWKDRSFNYTFDGIVYAVMASLGFAAQENISYIMYGGGLEVAAIRAITSIPGHCTFGIFMGYYFAYAKRYYVFNRKKEYRKNMSLCILVPILIHGTYDFLLSFKEWYFTVAFFVMIIILDVVAIKVVKKSSKNDSRIRVVDELL